MFYNKYEYKVRLLGEKRVRAVSVSFILLELGVLFFVASGIHFELSDNVVIYAILYSSYGFLMIGNAYMLFHTERKLKTAPLWSGLTFFLFGITMVVAFLILLFGKDYFKVTLFTGIYLLLFAVIGLIFRAINFYNLKKRTRNRSAGSTFLIYFIGVGIGRSIAAYVEYKYGDAGMNPTFMICFIILAILLGFAGVFSMNKYYLAKRLTYQSSISYKK